MGGRGPNDPRILESSVQPPTYKSWVRSNRWERDGPYPRISAWLDTFRCRVPRASKEVKRKSLVRGRIGDLVEN